MNTTTNDDNAYQPQGIYEKFQITSDTIFGNHRESLERRQARFIEKYLVLLVEMLMNRFKLDIDRAEDIVIAFTKKIIESGAIRKPAWGKFRYWMAKSLFRFARKMIDRDQAHQQKLILLKQRVQAAAEDIRDLVLDDLLGFEKRQIAKSIISGALKDELQHGILTGELTDRDVTIVMKELRDNLPRSTIAEQMNIDDSTVSRTMTKFYAYTKRHAKELRTILNNL